MAVEPGWAGAVPSDAELASAAMAGDRAAFARIYDRYADRLYDFCVGMLRDREAAADCVQDTFCTAATRLSQLRDPEKVRPWLYAIARNEGLRAISKRSREQPYDEVPEESSGEDGPATAVARLELADLVADACGGLSERDRSVLELSYRHGLDAAELGRALGVSTAAANKLVQRMRHTVQHSLGALLVSRAVRDNPNDCPELAAILEGGDGEFSVLMRKRIVRHIESCPMCDEQRRRFVNPVALLSGTPAFLSAPSWLRDQALADLPRAPATASARPSSAHDSSAPTTGAANGGGLRRRRPMLLVSAVAAVLAIPLVLSITSLEHHSAPVAPAVRTQSVSPPPAKATNGSRPETTGTAPTPNVVTKVAPAERPAPPTSLHLNSSSPVVVPKPEPEPIVAPTPPPARPASPPTSRVITKPPEVKPSRPPGNPAAPPSGGTEPTSPPKVTPQRPPVRIPTGPVTVTTPATSMPIIG